jgi:thymidylate kinase
MGSQTRIAFEGVNGAGKSHLISAVKTAIESQGGSAFVAKIGGLAVGSQARERFLELDRKRRESKLSTEEENCLARDLVFRDEYKRQIHELLQTDLKIYTHILLDRTPLMSWVFAASGGKSNQHLEEIREEAIRFTSLLALNRMLVVEIPPVLIYARLIARSLKHDRRKPIDRYLAFLNGCRPEFVQEVRSTALALANNPVIKPKPAAPSDFFSHRKLLNQIEVYRRVAKEAGARLGFDPFVFVNTLPPHEAARRAIEIALG